MEKNRTISFIKGLLISGLTLFILSLIYFAGIFNLGGGETIQEIETQRIILLIGITIVSIITVFTVRLYIRENRKYFAYGMGLLPLLGQTAVMIFFISNLSYSTPFEKAKWDQKIIKPYDIAVTLVKEQKLIGLNEKEVLEMLDSQQEYGKMSVGRHIEYLVENDWIMSVSFENHKVMQVTLRRPMLCV